MAKTLTIEVMLENLPEKVNADDIVEALVDTASGFTDGFVDAEVVDGEVV